MRIKNLYLRMPAWFFILCAIFYAILGIVLGLLMSNNFPPKKSIGVILIYDGQASQEEQSPEKMKT